MDLILWAFNYLVSLMMGTSLDSLFSKFYTIEKNMVSSNELPNSYNGLDLYDFIIVGAGSAGCVVANRLSAHNFRVLLLEAGGHPFPLTLVPALAQRLLRNPHIDWAYKSAPQKNAFKAHIDNTFIINRGKGLGGSSMLNYNMYARGSPYDYDDWANVTGDNSWRYENLLPIFKQLETYHGYFPNEYLHGSEGPLHVEGQHFVPLRKEWLEAGIEIGLKVKDPNGFQSESVFPIETMTMHGTRFSTHRAYLDPVSGRPNLKIVTYAHVQEIILDVNKRAVGVSYVSNGKAQSAFASKEVVLSAGAVGSPQLLMLSGIGPKEHLESLGIPVKVDLPVGKNYQDHYIALVGPIIVEKGKSIMRDRDFGAPSLQSYLHYGTGPFSSIGVELGALFASSLAPNPLWPDIYSTCVASGLSANHSEEWEQVYGYKPNVLKRYHNTDVGNDSFLAAVILAKPKSHGEVRLVSSDPKDHPIIDPNYFSHPDDMKVLVEGIQRTLKMVSQTKAFAKIGARLTSELFPGCEEFPDKLSNEYWDCHARHYCMSMWHSVGTCRMGRVGDPGAVVDSELRVLGVTGLRVIDASVMPNVTTTNTNVPTIMIAEKGSLLILDFWKQYL